MSEILQDILDLIRPYTSLLFLMVLPIVLHIYFCFRQNKWTGLIMPGLFFMAVVTSSVSSYFDVGGNPLWILASFFLLNTPTFGALIIYDICRRRVERKRAEGLMQETDEEVKPAR